MKDRKILGFTFPILLASFVLSSCGKGKTLETFTVTFKQDGYASITRKVEEGKAIENIPLPSPKYGYTVNWDVTDFTNIKSDLIVNAVATPNKYVLTYGAPGYSINGQTLSVTFDSVMSDLDMSLTREDATFLGWKYDDVIYTNESIWDVATNARLTPAWKEFDKCVVTFIDSDGQEIKKTVVKGKDLTDIPTVTPKTGYLVNWDVTDFSNIQEDIIVNAVLSPKTYQVKLDANGGNLSQTTVTVTYDQNYILPKPTHSDELAFVGWMYGTNKISTTGKWTLDVDGPIELIAEWGESDWTDIL